MHIENVDCKFERDITFIQLQAICKIMFKNKICIDDTNMNGYKWMILYANKPDDIKSMKVI